MAKYLQLLNRFFLNQFWGISHATVFGKVLNPKWGIQDGAKFQFRGFGNKKTIEIKVQVLYAECMYLNRRSSNRSFFRTLVRRRAAPD